MIEYTIKKYEIIGNPPSFINIGFLLENTDNGKKEYIEAPVEILKSQNRSPNEICQLAYLSKKEEFLKRESKLLSQDSIIDSIFIPRD